MIEVDEYLWETLFAMKCVYDHDPKSPLLQLYKDTVMDGDYVYEIAENAVDQFFADTRTYYNEEKEITTHVLYDPLMTEFWKLCEAYEEHSQLHPDENKFRKEMDRALECALSLPDYSYNAFWCFDTKHRGGCKLVLLYDCYFECYYMLPAAISEAHDVFTHYTKQIKEALSELDKASRESIAA